MSTITAKLSSPCALHLAILQEQGYTVDVSEFYERRYGQVLTEDDFVGIGCPGDDVLLAELGKDGFAISLRLFPGTHDNPGYDRAGRLIVDPDADQNELS